jgi:hypothetical protein
MQLLNEDSFLRSSPCICSRCVIFASAGPVVAAACVVLPGARLAAPIRDSKQTTEEEREAAFEELTHSPGSL